MVAEKSRKKYRNKMKRRLVLSILFLTISAILIIAFLGTRVGNFTIQLKPSNKQLALSLETTFNETTTRLRADKLKCSGEMSVRELPSDDILDKVDGYFDENNNPIGSHNGDALSSNNENGYDVGSNGNYLAYTFFLKNLGEEDAFYDFTLNLEGIKKPIIDGKEPLGLDEVIRVRIYSNKVTYDENNNIVSEHNYDTYAKAKRNVNVGEDQNEYVSDYYKEYGKAKLFNYTQGEGLINLTSLSISSQSIIRYTIVCWIEGDDPECYGQIPAGSAIQLGVKLIAY